MNWFPYFIAGWLFLIGLYGIVTSRHLVHLCLCLAVIQSSTYVLLIAIGYVKHGVAPVFVDAPVGAPVVDPIVQAIMLTDVVVEATVMALLLALVVQVFKRAGTLDPNRVREMRG